MHGVLLILGSHRANGNTAAAADRLRDALDLTDDQVLDLRLCSIEPFRYGGDMGRDDFGTVIGRVLENRHIVFATPVYWYAMSGLMKTFFDRLTDLLVEPEAREVGRALAGRNLWALATGTDKALPTGFTVPFEKTGDYFSMRWRGAFYVCVDDDPPAASAEAAAVRGLTAALMRAGTS
jgi:multimeric flavodoxin WrbA